MVWMASARSLQRGLLGPVYLYSLQLVPHFMLPTNPIYFFPRAANNLLLWLVIWLIKICYLNNWIIKYHGCWSVCLCSRAFWDTSFVIIPLATWSKPFSFTTDTFDKMPGTARGRQLQKPEYLTVVDKSIATFWANILKMSRLLVFCHHFCSHKQGPLHHQTGCQARFCLEALNLFSLPGVLFSQIPAASVTRFRYCSGHFLSEAFLTIWLNCHPSTPAQGHAHSPPSTPYFFFFTMTLITTWCAMYIFICLFILCHNSEMFVLFTVESPAQ